jgi:hypothetical protein
MMQHVMLVHPQHVVVEKRHEQNHGQHAVERRVAHDALVRGVVREREHACERHSGEDAAGKLGRQRSEEEHAGEGECIKRDIDGEQRHSAERMRRRIDVQLADQFATRGQGG